MQDRTRRSLRAEQVEATRAALVAAGRARFAAAGFGGTSVEDIAREAGVTTGALYHHFPNKAELFATVFETIEAELRDRSATAALAAGDEPLERLVAGFDAFLDAALEPDVQRIALVEAPAVLGLDRYHEIDERYGYTGILASVKAARSRGRIATEDPDTLAHLLLGALMHAGTLVARAEEPLEVRAAVGQTLRQLLDGLAGPSRTSTREAPD
ncbi:MAG: TetR family transcriptional regulator [Acidimicrobiia bacterium]|nr:TetR family transcriptional regulator [Acidimicrobiia bacterium]